MEAAYDEQSHKARRTDGASTPEAGCMGHISDADCWCGIRPDGASIFAASWAGTGETPVPGEPIT
jgi:hypothetical protein